MEIQEVLNQKNVFIPELGVIRCDTFSTVYPFVNNYLWNKEKFDPSRDGEVKEMLDVKTHITNPYRRCVGGYGRNINVFFLLAEAMWIAMGCRDVEFLSLFNKNMEKYSDDGKVFHAPYGWRMRHWGIRSEDVFTTDSNKGYDQIIAAIKLLEKNPNTRQVVINIWNPNFDLGFQTKDMPCNDILMLKIRNEKLIATIANRSNDLHLGLPTNIFQFSFLTELIAAALNIQLGTQTHNSQSLHVYSWNKSAEIMDSKFNLRRQGYQVIGDMYQEFGAEEMEMDFNFSHEVAANRFHEIEDVLHIIKDNLIQVSQGYLEDEGKISLVKSFSTYLYSAYRLLAIYIQYKANMSVQGVNVDELRLDCIESIEKMEEENEKAYDGYCGKKWDISMLAKNFFAERIQNYEHEYLGCL